MLLNMELINPCVNRLFSVKYFTDPTREVIFAFVSKNFQWMESTKTLQFSPMDKYPMLQEVQEYGSTKTSGV